MDSMEDSSKIKQIPLNDELTMLMNELREKYQIQMITATQIPRERLGFERSQVKVGTSSLVIIDHVSML